MVLKTGENTLFYLVPVCCLGENTNQNNSREMLKPMRQSVWVGSRLICQKVPGRIQPKLRHMGYMSILSFDLQNLDGAIIIVFGAAHLRLPTELM